MTKQMRTQKPRAAQVDYFVFPRDDPFAAGALRSAGLDPALPTKIALNAKAVAVLRDYIVRAAGGCREDLAKQARIALSKIEK